MRLVLRKLWFRVRVWLCKIMLNEWKSMQSSHKDKDSVCESLPICGSD